MNNSASHTSISIASSHAMLDELARVVVKKSVFIAYAARATTKHQAEEAIAQVRAAHPDARHVCSVWLLSTGEMHLSDDGEPSSTAALPMHTVLSAHHMCDVCMCVVRYFCGTLLGKGGLVRAYSDAALQGLHALTQAQALVSFGWLQTLVVSVSYAHFDKTVHVITHNGGVIIDTTFSVGVELEATFAAPAPDARQSEPTSASMVADLLVNSVSSSIITLVKEPYIGEIPAGV